MPPDRSMPEGRFGRRPARFISNDMVIDGPPRAGQTGMVDRIMKDSPRLAETSGFEEYYDPITAEPCGGTHVTPTAAMVLEIRAQEEAQA